MLSSDKASGDREKAMMELLDLGAAMEFEDRKHINGLTDRELLMEIKNALFDDHPLGQRSSMIVAVLREKLRHRDDLWG